MFSWTVCDTEALLHCDLKTKALGSFETSASQINDSAARIFLGAVTGITVRSSIYKATLSHWGNYIFPKNSKCEASIISRTLLFCAVTSGKNKTFLEFGFIRYSVWRYVLTRWVDTENKNARHTHSQQLQDYPHPFKLYRQPSGFHQIHSASVRNALRLKLKLSLEGGSTHMLYPCNLQQLGRKTKNRANVVYKDETSERTLFFLSPLFGL